MEKMSSMSGVTKESNGLVIIILKGVFNFRALFNVVERIITVRLEEPLNDRDSSHDRCFAMMH